jgi:hypothetical protein
MPEKNITVSLTRTQALALVKIAETGLAVVDALNLIPNTSAAEQGLNALKAAATRRAHPATDADP